MRWSLAAACALVVGACGPADGGGGDDDGGGDDGGGGDGGGGDGGGPTRVWDPAVREVRVEIDHERGKAPYTGMVIGFGDTFDLSRANLDRLFAGRKTVSLPVTLPFMQDIGDVADQELTIDDLLALAAQFRDGEDTATVKTYYVLFVGGQYADGNGVRPGTLGVTLGDTGIIAIFKDVVASTASVTAPNVERYVEQSTIVHEIGHAIGLVPGRSAG